MNDTTLSDEKLEGPHPLNVNRADNSKPYPKSGTLQLEFNKAGTLLLARFGKKDTCYPAKDLLIHYQTNLESVPTSVHLFAFPGPGEVFSPRLRSVLLHSSPVMHVHWNPVRQGRLALSCGGQAMYLWSEEWIGESGAEEEMAECVGIPASALNKLPYHSCVGARALIPFFFQRNLTPEMCSGHLTGRGYCLSIERHFVVHLR